MCDVYVHLLDLPCKTHEAVSQNEDGSYTVILNSKLSRKAQFEAFVHAVEHIKKNDFEKADVQSIELNAHGGNYANCT